MSADVQVVDRDILEAEYAAKFKKPWLVELASGEVLEFDTEAAACAHQRAWRKEHNLDEMTGEPK